MVSKLEVQVELKSPAEKIWNSVRDSATLFPIIFPDEYKSIEILEGDGKSVGSIRLIKYSEVTPDVTFSKEQIDEADEEKKILVYSVIDSELANVYKNFKAFLQVIPKDEGGLVKWSAEFEKVTEQVPDPVHIKDFAVKTFHGLDDYLVKAAA